MDDRLCLVAEGCLSLAVGEQCLSLRLPCRGVYALVGPNGVGKTTLLRVLAGVLDGGWFRGRLAVERPLAYLPEEHFAPPFLAVREWLWAHGVPQAVVEGVLPRRVQGERIGRLSHGWRRLVELAATLLSGAAVYLLDEPFQGLDPERLEAAWRLIHTASQDALVLLTAHTPEELTGGAVEAVVWVGRSNGG